VACSGGLDSVTLLHLLRFGGGHDPTALLVAHFDHRMRPGSGDDAAWVRGLCRAWGVPIREGSAVGGLRGETAARRARWRFLEGVAADVGAVGVVTAHHADDQVETVVHHLLRGTGPRGMAGMTVREGQRIRPLLDVRRATIADWAKERGLPLRLDPTNREATTPRNHLRLEGLPLLESIRPGAALGVLRSARLAGQAEAALCDAEDLLWPSIVQRTSPGRITADLEALVRLGPALRARLLRRLARDVGGRLDEAGTRAAMQFAIGRSGGSVCGLTGGVVLRRSLGVLEIEGPTRGPRQPDEGLDIPDRGPGSATVAIGGESWRVAWGSERSPSTWTAALNLASRDFPLRVRVWRAGDRVRVGRRERSVSRTLSAEGVPLHERRLRPVVEDCSGRLLWVPGSVLLRPEIGAATTPLFMEIARADNH
jgi:tRNA(Ile)-lysidine synthase